MLKPPKSCSPVGDDYIYINQLVSKRYSNKFKNNKTNAKIDPN